MKKANLKTFVKKMLILGFCVPTTFVCSAVPAMAETAAQSTTAPAAGQTTNEQVQTDTAQTSTAGKTENSNPQKEESVIGGAVQNSQELSLQ